MNWRYHTPLYGARMIPEAFRSPQSQDNVSKLAEQAMDTLRKSFKELHDNASINQSLLLSQSLNGQCEVQSDGAADQMLLKAQILGEKVRRLELLLDQLGSRIRNSQARAIDIQVLSDFKVYQVPGKDLSAQVRSLLLQIQDQCAQKLSLTLGIDFKDFHSALSYLQANKPQSQERAADQYFSQLQLRRELENAQLANEQCKQQVAELQARLQNQFKLHDNYVRKQETREEGANRQMIKRIQELEDKLADCARFEAQEKLRQADVTTGLQTSPTLCLEFARNSLLQSRHGGATAFAEGRQTLGKSAAEHCGGRQLGLGEFDSYQPVVDQLGECFRKELFVYRAELASSKEHIQRARKQALQHLESGFQRLQQTAGRVDCMLAENTVKSTWIRATLTQFEKSAHEGFAGLKKACCAVRSSIASFDWTACLETFERQVAARVQRFETSNEELSMQLQELRQKSAQEMLNSRTLQALFYGEATPIAEQHFAADLNIFLTEMRLFAKIQRDAQPKDLLATMRTRIADIRVLEERCVVLEECLRKRGAAVEDIFAEADIMMQQHDALCCALNATHLQEALDNLQQLKQQCQQAQVCCQQMQLAFRAFIDGDGFGSQSSAHSALLDGATLCSDSGHATAVVGLEGSKEQADSADKTKEANNANEASTGREKSVTNLSSAYDLAKQVERGESNCAAQRQGFEYYSQKVFAGFQNQCCNTASDMVAQLATAQQRRFAPLRSALDHIAGLSCSSASAEDLQQLADQIVSEREILRAIERDCQCSAGGCLERFRSMLAASASVKQQNDALFQEVQACKVQLGLAQDRAGQDESRFQAERAQIQQQDSRIRALESDLQDIKAQLNTAQADAKAARDSRQEAEQAMLQVLTSAGFEMTGEDTISAMNVFASEARKLFCQQGVTGQQMAVDLDAIPTDKSSLKAGFLAQLAAKLTAAQKQQETDFKARQKRVQDDKCILLALDGMQKHMTQLAQQQVLACYKATERLNSAENAIADALVLQEKGKLRFCAVYQSITVERDTLQVQMKAKDKLIDDLRSESDALRLRIQDLQDQDGDLKKQLRALQDSFQAKQAELDSSSQQIVALKAQVGQLLTQLDCVGKESQQELNKLRAQHAATAEQLNEARSGTEQVRFEIQALQQEKMQREAQQIALVSQLEADKQVILHQLESQKQSFESAQQALSLNLERREAHNKELQKAVKYYDAKAELAEQDLQRYQQTAKQQAGELEVEQARHVQLQKEMALQLHEKEQEVKLVEYELASTAKILEDKQKYAEKLRKQLEDKNVEARELCCQLNELRSERDNLEMRLRAHLQKVQLGEEQASTFKGEAMRLSAEVERLKAELAEKALLESSEVQATNSVIYDAKSIKQLLFDIYQLEESPHRRGVMKQAVDRLAVLCFSLEFHRARRPLECSEDVELSRILRDKLAEKHLEGSFAQDEKLTLRLCDDLAGSKTVI